MILPFARTALLAGCASIAFPAFAENGDLQQGSSSGAITTTAAQPATEIVVVGSMEDADTIPGSSAIVTETDLERTRPLNVNDALRLVPGVFVREEEGAGMRPNIGIRGLNPVRSTKVLLLEDGIPLGYAPYGDNASYYHPPIQRFTRLEVLKGAGQIRFGPQTIGGVVNYITPEVPDEFIANGTVAGGNRDMLMLDGMVGGRLAGGGVLVHVNHNQTDGFRDNQALRFTDIFVKGGWEFGPDHGLTIKLSRFREDSRVGYSGLRRDEFAADPRGNPFVNDDFQTERLNATIAHRWNLSDNLTLRTSAYYHYFTRDWWRQSSNSGQRPNDSSDPACGGMANLLTACGNEGRLRDYDTYGIESRLAIDHALFGIGGETEIGVRYHEERQRRRQWNGDTPTARRPGTSVNAGVRENNERDATAFAAFIQSRLEFGAFALTPGVRAEFIDFARRNLPIDILVGGRPSGAVTAATSGTSSLDKVLPGIGATWAIRDYLTLYGGVHRGFAPPRVEDIITAAGGSVDLDAELSWNYEIGLRGDIVPGIGFDATAFVMDFQNQIVAQSVAGGVGATLTSAGETLHRGGEFALNASSRAAGWTGGETDVFARLALTWVADAEYNSTRIATAPCFDGATTGTLVATGAGAVPCGVARNVEGNRLPYSPEWLVSGALGVEHKGFTGQVELVSQSSIFADDVNLIPVTPDGQRGLIEGWTQVNLAASYGPPGGKWEVFTTARNLFDRLYVTDRARGILPGQPFTIQVGLTLRY
ncbi:TonB-dependent receptor family protein [Porphyrobacter sp. CACIAM 03H1]|uniref:TonB-dependent receptor family protein n=1 Tax=Porphyrobacter sp. CACIAM 03H1 TaxID=2003315 RepID=UPI000B5A7640|nr:TonB-dependent receptor [Porphyrobacter sp. CACIAM 03H1]ASJ92230.1 TonB-dependent receptor [Porphyrobacter sp. CACIAM 03H1]